MTREEAIKLVKEVTGMSLDWDNAHYEALQMAIKALEQETYYKDLAQSYEKTIVKLTEAIAEQEPSDDKVIITMNKGTLKYSNREYVIYNKDWFRKHFATEVEIITGYDGYIKQPTSEDCVSRQAVLEKINDWWGITSTSGEPTLCDCIRELPPVTPTRKKGKWIDKSQKSGCGITFIASECTCCGKKTLFNCNELIYRYCPNCGAEMESEK